MLKVYSLISISFLISAYGTSKYKFTSDLDKSTFLAKIDEGEPVTVKVCESGEIVISDYMKPDGQQKDQIVKVISDGLCKYVLEDSSMEKLSETYKYKNPMCTLLEYYYYPTLDFFINLNNFDGFSKNESQSVNNEFDLIFMKILSGLNYLHDPQSRGDKSTQPVIHMDIKPQNIYVPQSNVDYFGKYMFDTKLGNFDHSLFGTTSSASKVGTPSSASKVGTPS
eukprot:GHVR01150937.1.p1 GENE.GHVR01150937.1~~GHVR01150937.1.p1  ORF type:complete len:224 (+),score=24.64 GHVR01150937.1:337-1008(+)